MYKILNEILNLNKINFNNIVKQDAERNSRAYFIDNNFIVKLAEQDNKNFKKEIKFYKANTNLAFIPKLVAHGIHKKNSYLIINNVAGDKLIDVWEDVSSKEKETIVIQLAQILKNFHLLNYKFLPKKAIKKNWINFLKLEFKELYKALDKLNISNLFIKEFINSKLKLYFNKLTFGLVYNNVKFNNIIYESGVIKILNFNKILYCPIDYELLKICHINNNENIFAQKKDTLPNNKTISLSSALKKYYPQLFEVDFLKERLVIYNFLISIKHALKIKHFTKTKNLINDFSSFFNL